jgi:hypothetical protein
VRKNGSDEKAALPCFYYARYRQVPSLAETWLLEVKYQALGVLFANRKLSGFHGGISPVQSASLQQIGRSLLGRLVSCVVPCSTVSARLNAAPSHH